MSRYLYNTADLGHFFVRNQDMCVFLFFMHLWHSNYTAVPLFALLRIYYNSVSPLLDFQTMCTEFAINMVH